MIFMMILCVFLRIPGFFFNYAYNYLQESYIPAAQVLYATVTRPLSYAEGLAMPD